MTEKTKEDLADFVRRVRSEKDLSLKDVEDRSSGKISRGYVNQIENRAVLSSHVTPGKLAALAHGLGVSEDDIFKLARGMNGNGSEFDESHFAVLYSKHKRLSKKGREQFKQILEMVDRELDRLEKEELK